MSYIKIGYQIRPIRYCSEVYQCLKKAKWGTKVVWNSHMAYEIEAKPNQTQNQCQTTEKHWVLCHQVGFDFVTYNFTGM